MIDRPPPAMHYRELARTALDCRRRNDRDLRAAMAPLRDAFQVQDAAGDARLLAALQDAADASDNDAAGALLQAAAAPPPLLRPAADYRDAPIPRPVLWRDQETDGRPPDAVVSIGEVAALSSAGGLGKSTITLALAHAGAAAKAAGMDYFATCGLRVTAGAVVMVSYEDAPERIAHRLGWFPGTIPDDLYLAPSPAPLWQAGDGGESKQGADWRRLWDDVRRVDARLVVIDPVSAALADVSTSETGPVRAFLRDLTAEAMPNREAGWNGCAVLLVGHSTKSARNALSAGQDPNAGVIAGSAAWYDACRAVLTMFDSLITDDRVLSVAKCNYGPRGWGVRLGDRRGRHGEWHGLEAVGMLSRQQVAAHQTPPRKDGRKREAAPPQKAAAEDNSQVSAEAQELMKEMGINEA